MLTNARMYTGIKNYSSQIKITVACKQTGSIYFPTWLNIAKFPSCQLDAPI